MAAETKKENVFRRQYPPLSTMVDPPARHLLDLDGSNRSPVLDFSLLATFDPEIKGDTTCRLVSWDSLTCNCWKDPAACRRITCQESPLLSLGFGV